MKIFLASISLFISALFLTGCGNNPEKVAFDSAALDIKAIWSQAVADSRANHYVAANTNFVSLLRRDLSAAQISAVQGALSALNVRMNDAAAHGDAEAKRAMETLQAMQQGRRTPGSLPH